MDYFWSLFYERMQKDGKDWKQDVNNENKKAFCYC